jgi:hypothetical protein
MKTSRRLRFINILTGFTVLVLLGGCLPGPKPGASSAATAYRPAGGEQLLRRYAPVFWIEADARPHNRIGTVRANSPKQVFIDPETPTIYAEQRQFTTSAGSYTNLIYRAHFQKVPGGLSPYYLTAGKNVGLLLVITLDAAGQPLLFTSVHTCGCYLAFIPTSFLPQQARPQAWKTDRQLVFSENLPGYLAYDSLQPEQLRLQLRIRPDNHRVMDLWLAKDESLPPDAVSTDLQPLEALNRLPLANGKETTSFFETGGARKGYVKGSFKTRERLFMSWWALDWRIGQDKYLGKDRQDGPIFFTSLKPWARRDSDMRDFGNFLAYWGWHF